MEKLKRIVGTIFSKNNQLPSPQKVQRRHSLLDETSGDPKYSEQVIFEAMHLYKPDKLPKTTIRVTEGVSSIQHDQDKTKSQPQVTDKREDTPEFLHIRIFLHNTKVLADGSSLSKVMKDLATATPQQSTNMMLEHVSPAPESERILVHSEDVFKFLKAKPGKFEFRPLPDTPPGAVQTTITEGSADSTRRRLTFASPFEATEAENDHRQELQIQKKLQYEQTVRSQLEIRVKAVLTGSYFQIRGYHLAQSFRNIGKRL